LCLWVGSPEQALKNYCKMLEFANKNLSKSSPPYRVLSSKLRFANKIRYQKLQFLRILSHFYLKTWPTHRKKQVSDTIENIFQETYWQSNSD
jgi:hypothetical protein